MLSKDFYRRLTDKKLSLCIGIILLGIIDLVVPFVEKYKEIFIGKSQTVLYYNIALAVAFVIIIGLIDVLFFSLPLFDLFKVFPKEVEIQSNSSLIVKIMKIQITANLLVLIPSLVIILMYKNLNLDKHPFIVSLALLLSILIPIWFCSAISRGINSIYSFKPIFKMLVLTVVLIWFFLVNYFALSYVIDNWVFVLFK